MTMLGFKPPHTTLEKHNSLTKLFFEFIGHALSMFSSNSN